MLSCFQQRQGTGCMQIAASHLLMCLSLACLSRALGVATDGDSLLDRESYAAWLRDLKDGAIARHQLLPLMHSDAVLA